MADSSTTAATAPAPFDARAYRNALGCFATGVTIITTRRPNGEYVGLTANSFTSVSLDPPLILWSLDRRANSLPAFEESLHFAVNVLAKGQADLSTRFAKAGENKFDGLKLQQGIGGVPLLDGCAARFQCKSEFRYWGGDHIIFIGRVEAFDSCGHPPLLFVRGRYGEHNEI